MMLTYMLAYKICSIRVNINTSNDDNNNNYYYYTLVHPLLTACITD